MSVRYQLTPAAAALRTQIALELGAAMRRSGMSKGAIGELLGVSAPRVSQMISAREFLSLRTLAHVADVLDHDVRITLSPRWSVCSCCTERHG